MKKTLTLRLDENTSLKLADVMEKLDEQAASKAIVKMIETYIDLIKEKNDLKDRLVFSEQSEKTTKGAIKNFLSSFQELKSITT